MNGKQAHAVCTVFIIHSLNDDDCVCFRGRQEATPPRPRWVETTHHYAKRAMHCPGRGARGPALCSTWTTSMLLRWLVLAVAVLNAITAHVTAHTLSLSY